MNTLARYARFAALPIVSAGLIGGGALGLAGVASADMQQPNIVAAPSVKAQPAPQAQPGGHWHHGMHHLRDLERSYSR